jgi:hypothetical protein
MRVQSVALTSTRSIPSARVQRLKKCPTRPFGELIAMYWPFPVASIGISDA